MVGNVPVGDMAPISVQSMTNTPTSDIDATVSQIDRLQDAGCEIIRLAVPDVEAARAISRIKSKISIPLIADIHFDYKIALKVAEYGVDCLRSNPGNIGREDRIRAVIDAAKERGIPCGALVGAKHHAIKQAEAGVDILIVAGTEAGGHCGEVSTMVLVPEVAMAVEKYPDVAILAAGGIVTGRQMAAAMASLADGAEGSEAIGNADAQKLVEAGRALLETEAPEPIGRNEAED